MRTGAGSVCYVHTSLCYYPDEGSLIGTELTVTLDARIRMSWSKISLSRNAFHIYSTMEFGDIRKPADEYQLPTGRQLGELVCGTHAKDPGSQRMPAAWGWLAIMRLVEISSVHPLVPLTLTQSDIPSTDRYDLPAIMAKSQPRP
jgi:hypothetical protein